MPARIRASSEPETPLPRSRPQVWRSEAPQFAVVLHAVPSRYKIRDARRWLEEDNQYLVSVPKLLDPPLSFFCYSLDELRDVATRELAAYFSKHSLEDLLPYQYQRQE